MMGTRSELSTSKTNVLLRVNLVCVTLFLFAAGPAVQAQDAHPQLLNEVLRLLQNGEFEQAAAPIEEYLAGKRAALGDKTSDFAFSLIRLGDMCFQYGGYSLAESLYSQALEILEKLEPKGRLSIIVQTDLAATYMQMGQFDLAEKRFGKALQESVMHIGEWDECTGAAANGLAGVARAKAKYDDAERLYQRALTIAEHIPQADRVPVAASNLAGFYAERGEYVKAESLFLRAIALENSSSNLGPEIVSMLVGLATVYNDKGDAARALPLVERAVAIAQRGSNRMHPDVGLAMTGAGLIAMSLHDYATAEKRMNFALDIAKKIYGLTHINFATALGNLAYVYLLKGEYAISEPLLRRALEITKHALGENNPEVARNMSNLALACERIGKLDEAEALMRQSIIINERTIGPQHANTAKGLENLAGLLWSRGKILDAWEPLQRAITIQDKNLSLIIGSGSEAQKRAYLDVLDGSTDRILTFQTLPGVSVDTRRLAAVTILRRKGRVLDALADETKSIRRSLASEDQSRFDQLLSLRAREAALVARGLRSRSPKEYDDEIHSLEAQQDELQQRIAASDSGFLKASQPIELEDIQNGLGGERALVEFVWYRPYIPAKDAEGPKLDQPRYGAFVILDVGEPFWLDVGKADIIDKAAHQFHRALASKLNIDKPADDLDALIFARIRSFLQGRKEILIAPDGELNLVPFSALRDENKQYLISSYTITYLSSGRDLLRFSPPVGGRQDTLVLADPDFFGRYNSLDGTLREADNIKRILTNARVLTGKAATKAALLNISRESIVHVATHGFFDQFSEPPMPGLDLDVSRVVFPDDTPAPSPKRTDNPLLHSGLELAGETEEISRLTALEATGLNLQGTQLVTLSACDTGLGDIRVGDGVQGLRRALVVAGAQAQIISLWAVNDPATAKLMGDFYAQFKNSSAGQALRQAQLMLLGQSGREHPYYWAAFILSGNPRSTLTALKATPE